MTIAILKPAPLVKSGELTRELVEAYSAALNEPGWMTARRLEAWRVFRDTPAPQRSDELWRRVDLGAFKLDQIINSVTPAADGNVETPAGWPVLATAENAPGWLLNVNGSNAQRQISADLAARGVVFTDLDTAIREHGALVEQYLMTECVKLTSSYFAALHGALVHGGTLLYVPKGVTVELPLRTGTWMSAGQRTGFNHTLVVLEEGARATLIEEFASAGAGGSRTAPTTAVVGNSRTASATPQTMYDGVVELILRDGSQLDYVNVQDWGRDVWNFTTERAHIHAGATLHWVSGGLGARFTKTALEVDMLGEHGTALLSGVFFADSRQQMHYDTQQNHIAPGCKSDLLYKNALRDESRTVWRGNIRVFPKAQKTDGYQANRNLQLSSRSRADSIPGLEIEADDVRCTHGATVGRIEEEPMFYMATRGVPEVEARRLIVEGFFAPVIQRIPLEETRDRLTEEIGKKIDR
jgi:Fe-S cluster assembly protein SufD